MAMRVAYSFTLVGHFDKWKLQKVCNTISYAAHDIFNDIDINIKRKKQKLILTVKHLKGKVNYRFGHDSIKALFQKKGFNIEQVSGYSYKLYA